MTSAAPSAKAPRDILHLSVVVLTFNEERNIARCLRSVAWADDVLVVDSGSSDRTCTIAEEMGARIVFRKFDNFAAQRNYALDEGALRHEWVLHIDADEEVSAALRAEIANILQDHEGPRAYLIPEKLMLHGKWLKRAGMYPRYQARLGTKSELRFQMVGHGQRETLPPEKLGVARGELIHHNFSKGISEWITKHSKYAKDEALGAKEVRASISLSSIFSSERTARRRALKKLSTYMPMRPAFRFIYIAIFRGGIFDGAVGVRYAFMMAVYQWMIDLNAIEQQDAGAPSGSAVEAGR